MSRNNGGIRIAIDRGGTFTDVYAELGGESHIVKLLSEDPHSYKDAPTEGIRRILEKFYGIAIPRGQPLDLSQVESVRMGTTVATNALLERKGDRVAFMVTAGFRDILKIGQQSRPSIFDLTAAKLAPLYEEVFEVDERLLLAQWGAGRDIPASLGSETTLRVVEGESGEKLLVEKAIDLDAVRATLLKIKTKGFQSVAIAFMHAYLWPGHELAVAELAREIGFNQVSLSSEVQPMVKLVARGHSAVADGYLSPTTARYISQLAGGFEGGLDSVSSKLLFMQSDGGLARWDKFSGLRAVLSGPAGGVVGYAQTSQSDDDSRPVLGFDMGGTSTDVSRYSGELEHVYETTIAQINIQAPQLNIQTVAAGGGSILAWRNGLFAVGPDSAGAHPGPACYRKGGPLTITDANLFLGRIDPSTFPAIFGPDENQQLDSDIVRSKFKTLTEKINADRADGAAAPLSAEQVAYGFISVANETMARPIRAMTEGRGLSTTAHILASFGGAGGQHACELAKRLGISNVVIHQHSSILSAFGIAVADVVCDLQRPAASVLSVESSDCAVVFERLDLLAAEAKNRLCSQGHSHVDVELFLNLQYRGSETLIMIKEKFRAESLSDRVDNFKSEFESIHKTRFGFVFHRDILIGDIRARGIARSTPMKKHSLKPPSVNGFSKTLQASAPEGGRVVSVYFEEGWLSTRLHRLHKLSTGTVIAGPSMILDDTQTIVVPPGFCAYVAPHHLLIEEVNGDAKVFSEPNRPDVEQNTTEEDPVLLSIFAHRFMSIAEQMGTALQQTAISTNIKERLDFSCAVFDPRGGLVANAPHIPVHLGSMSSAVAAQIKLWENKLDDGDVLIANHPAYGGSHLPDITVMQPVYCEGKVVFWVASRGHHSDIGGITAGSMPPFSQYLWQEGAIIPGFKIMRRGNFDAKGFENLLITEPAKYPECSGSRSYADSVSDLHAQIAANRRGIELLEALCAEQSLPVVQQYMLAIQKNAEMSVKSLLRGVAAKHGTSLYAKDYLDDGTVINLTVSINAETGSASFDFRGTGPQVLGNLNAPPAITKSAILYCLRSMITDDIPLNHGCLVPLEIIIPPNTVLSPGPEAACVGGNVETSQRVCDVIFHALHAVAGSQGTCNNFTFGSAGGDGSPSFGYYETIAGGAGAGPAWHGQSGVQVHMTNTRATDPEVFERRYPVLLRQFSLRTGSGGRGIYCGGDGVIREVEFRQKVQASILSERRSRAPYGLAGGEPGAMGINLWVKAPRNGQPGTTVSIGGKATIEVSAGDRVLLMTPGGGGYGAVCDKSAAQADL